MIDIWISLVLVMTVFFVMTFLAMMFALYIWEVMLYGWRRREVARRLRITKRRRRERNSMGGMFDDDRQWVID